MWHRYHHICYEQRQAYLAIRHMHGEGRDTPEKKRRILQMNRSITETADSLVTMAQRDRLLMPPPTWVPPAKRRRALDLAASAHLGALD